MWDVKFYFVLKNPDPFGIRSSVLVAWSLYLRIILNWPGPFGPEPDGINLNSIERILPIHRWKLGLSIPNILSETARPLPEGTRVSHSVCQTLGPECIPQPCPGCTGASRHLVGTRVLKNET